ncbi:TadE family protein [Stratiformator vulcanicus]|uniref:TadE-like protein n=1 Tax=Stratiformator vulcanicus TaxID=2527980 RepID=A0A517R2R4_9PLAN|nr:TadE family protein [Stratiformator vulcanicus]QDT38141.1 TadE-like protein [Stratiformator vulcanicus]
MQTQKLNSTRRVRRRPLRGILSAELILALPVLLMVGAMMFEIGMLLHARGVVVDAARNGARHASYVDIEPESVREHTLRSLGPFMSRFADVSVRSAERTGDPVEVVVRVPMQAAAPNLLWPFGFDLRGRELIAATKMTKE